MTYIKPADVVSPKKQWNLVEVIIDGGPAQPAYAIGTWDGPANRRVGFRWNGSEDSPLGNPQSRGLPTWTMLDPNLHATVVAITPKAQQAFVGTYLGVPIIELAVDFHPSGKFTLKERSLGQGVYRDFRPGSGLFANSNATQFYREVARKIAALQAEGKYVVYNDCNVDLPE